MADLSVIIPARREEWLNLTVEDVLAHTSDATEVIVIADGDWPEVPLPQHPRLQVVYLPKAIGQRAATNLGARISTATYIAKLDAHCSVKEGWDTELIRAADELGPNVCQIPAQKNLHVYDWICKDCWRREYQRGLEACKGCNSTNLDREVVWKPRGGVHTKRWRFDSDLHFQYWGGEGKGDFTETMSCLGACWFIAREQWYAIGGLDEGHGSWGQVGTELSCKVWLSGGRMITNNRTWYAHFFRVGGQQFPYPITGSEQDYARRYSQHLWRGNRWEGQIRPLRWLVDRFWPVPGWTEEQRETLSGEIQRGDATRAQRGRPFIDAVRAIESPDRSVGVRSSPTAKGLVYYSDCRPDSAILETVRRQLDRVRPGPIYSVTLAQVSLPDGWKGHVLEAERSYLSMFRQILAGLEALETEYVFLVEHDCLYPEEHFAFTPPTRDRVYYNQHVWKVDADIGRALHYRCSQTSGLCADRQLLIEHYRRRVGMVEQSGFSRAMGFEPGTHNRAERVDDLTSETWMSSVPIVDIRHGKNLTASRWTKGEFRNQHFTEGWTEGTGVPGWGETFGRFNDFLQGVKDGAVLQAVA
jgi:glycosyltransferase involved in cell wall biosynthesis